MVRVRAGLGVAGEGNAMALNYNPCAEALQRSLAGRKRDSGACLPWPLIRTAEACRRAQKPMLLKPLDDVVGSTKEGGRPGRQLDSQSERSAKRSGTPHNGRAMRGAVLAAGVQDPGAILGIFPI
jgi:hypothetical protein